MSSNLTEATKNLTKRLRIALQKRPVKPNAGVDRTVNKRKPPTSNSNWQRNTDFQLDFLASICDNVNITGARVLVHPSPPNHDRGVGSTMIDTEHSIQDYPSQVTPKPTYPQNWPAYNAAQTNEKDTFMVLLADLCASIEQPEYSFGRPRLPLSDMVYASTMKVYSGFSSRRFDSDVRDAHTKGYISVAPAFNSVSRYISDPDLTDVIKGLIEQSAGPLNGVETTVAADSSGFSTSRFDRWYDHKWGKEQSKRKWLKAHIMAGTKTNIVTSVEVTASNVNDSPMLPGLLDKTAETFQVTEVSADKAYLSDANLKHIEGHGAYPYIPFKVNTTGKGSPRWRRLYAYFVLHEEAFNASYHRRSNVETVFSMVKGKFGDSLLSKSNTGQVNEILLKFLCHNIVVLIHEIHELGIATPSWGRN